MTEHQPVTLNKLDVARAAAKAYREGRLSAQGSDPRCKYRDRSGCPCVIGAAIDDETANRFDRDWDGSSVTSLWKRRLIEADDLGALADLQVAHDEWANGLIGSKSTLVALLNKILPAEEKIA